MTPPENSQTLQCKKEREKGIQNCVRPLYHCLHLMNAMVALNVFLTSCVIDTGIMMPALALKVMIP